MSVVVLTDVAGHLVQGVLDVEPLELDAVQAVNVARAGFEASSGGFGATRIGLTSAGKTATAVSGAATLNNYSGQITSEALTTAAAAEYTLTLTNSAIAASDLVFASLQLGTATTGVPVIQSVTPAAGSVVIKVLNAAASAALNGTIIISFVVFKQ